MPVAKLATKPELALYQILNNLDSNPVAPINLKKDTTVLNRINSADFKAAWDPVSAEDERRLAGKDKFTTFAANPGINKVRRLFKFTKPLCDEESTGDCSTNICEVDNPTVDPYGYLQVGIDQCNSESWSVSPKELMSIDQTVSSRRAKALMDAHYKIKQTINKKLIEFLYSSISDYADGTLALGNTVRDLRLISDKGDILPVGKAKLDREYRHSDFDGEYVMFGGETLADYYAVKGYRLSPEGKMGVADAMADLPFIYDSRFDKIFQSLGEDVDSHVVAVPIGSILFDTWNEHTGEMEMKDANYMYTTLDIEGLVYDYSFKFDECDKVYKEMITLHWGIGSMPDEIYCDGNGLIRHFTASCGPVDCDVLRNEVTIPSNGTPP
jgi:hypothetical protein